MKIDLKKWLGSKTRRAALVVVGVTLAQQTGLTNLTPEQVNAILALCGAGAAVGLRDAVDKAKE